MVRLLCAVAAIAMVAPGVATAQHHRNDSSRYDNHRRDNDRKDNHRYDNRHKRSYGTYRIGHRPSTFRRVKVGSYHYPRGHHYRRWVVGAILPRLFLSSAYYFPNYTLLGLGAPPPGYVWVRYGPDLLLVNRRNGRIVDVIYGAFY